MSNHLNVGRTGAVLGLALGTFHLCWVALVAAGWAQPFLDFVFWAHFIKPVYAIEPFEAVKAVILVCLTAGIGFMMGSIFAVSWNLLHKR